MRKFITLAVVVVLCLSLALPAYAAIDIHDDVLTKPAPSLAADEQGFFGALIDAAGNTISGIGENIIVIIPHSEAGSDNVSDEIKSILGQAYDSFASADTLFFVEGVIGSNNEIESLGSDEMLISDLFYIYINDADVAASLESDDVALKLTFKPVAALDELFDAFIFTGEEWEPVEVSVNDDGTVTCIIKNVGPVCFVMPREEQIGEATETEGIGSSETVPSTTESTVPTIVGPGFVPSIAGKDAPDIVVDPDGNIGTIDTPDDNSYQPVTQECFQVLSIAEAFESDSDIAKALLALYARLADPNTSLSTEAPDMNAVAEKVLGAGSDADDFVIRDLFDISFVCEEHADLLPQDGYKLKLTFDLGVSPDTFITTMVYSDGIWHPVTTTNNGDNTVSCIFERVGPVAFLTPAADDAAANDSAIPTNAILWCAAAAACVVGYIIYVAKYSNNKKGKKK